jgi:hypothetical protein
MLVLAPATPGPAHAAQTLLFEKPGTITIPGTGTSGNASPFPSVLGVSGLPADRRVTRVRVFLGPFHHTHPADVDMMLVAPTGEAIVLMADAGANSLATVSLLFDDCALSSLPWNNSLRDGAYRPTNYGATSVPIIATGHSLSSFAGRSASTLNGSWSLYVADDTGADTGTIEDTWGLRISMAEPGVPVSRLSCSPDFDLDGVGDIVAALGAGGSPLVTIQSGVSGASLFSFLPYDPGLNGGVRVAACDFNGDGVPDVLTAAGPGGGPHVRVIDGATSALLLGPLGVGFFPYDPGFTGGAYVGCADMNGDGVPDVIVGPGSGGGPHVRVYDGRTAQPMAGLLGTGIFPYPAGFTGGVFVGP